MDDLSEFLDRSSIRDDYGRKIEGLNIGQSYLQNVPYSEKELSIDAKKRLFQLDSIDRRSLIELNCTDETNLDGLHQEPVQHCACEHQQAE